MDMYGAKSLQRCRSSIEHGKFVRDYYLNLEEAMFEYGKYTMTYMIDQRALQLTIKDDEKRRAKEELEEEKAESRSLFKERILSYRKALLLPLI